MTPSRRSFLTGISATATAAASGLGAVQAAMGAAAPVVIPKEEALDCLVEGYRQVRSQVWVSLPGQPMVYLGEASGVTLEALTDEAKRQVKRAVMDSMAAPPGFSVAMPARVGCTTLEEATRGGFDLVADGQGDIWPEDTINTNTLRLIGEPLPLITVAEEDMLPVEIQGTIERTEHDQA